MDVLRLQNFRSIEDRATIELKPFKFFVWF